MLLLLMRRDGRGRWLLLAVFVLLERDVALELDAVVLQRDLERARVEYGLGELGEAQRL